MAPLDQNSPASQTTGQPKWQFWIDRGGTFTDIVARKPNGALVTHKLLSENPERYKDAAIQGIRELLEVADGEKIPAEKIEAVKMGTTVATNALLERKGDRTVLVTNKGFRDALRLAYQNRPRLFDRNIILPETLYETVIETAGRFDAQGHELEGMDLDTLRADLQKVYDSGIRACAIVFMHGYRYTAHELAAAQTRLQISTASSNGQKPAERVAVRSPVNGAVLALVRQSEGVIQAGEPILEVGDPGALEVVVEVLSFDAVKLEPGLGVRLSGWGGPVLEATVRRIEPIGFEDVSALGVEEQRVQVIADMVSPREQWRQLGDGYRVDADFILWQSEDTLQVPTSAIFEYNGASAVFVVESETARRRTVTTGPSNGLMTQVTQGLQEGVQVVRHPGRGLEDGDQVRIR